jgi:hypothetical protein
MPGRCDEEEAFDNDVAQGQELGCTVSQVIEAYLYVED